jgi:NADPH:quinone reductase-like Zn-dependent oxidoreductase
LHDNSKISSENTVLLQAGTSSWKVYFIQMARAAGITMWE